MTLEKIMPHPAQTGAAQKVKQATHTYPVVIARAMREAACTESGMSAGDIRAPQPDADAILRTLTLLFNSDDVVELRALTTRGRKRIDAGYFDGEHRSDLVNEAVRLNKAGAAVYVPLNQINSQLLGRYANRIEQNATTTTDADIKKRRWLLLDFDPVRPKDTSASDAQLLAAKAKAREVYAYLKSLDWHGPVSAESGNGMHLLYPLDLPNDDESRDLIKGVLAALASRFDDDSVKLDQSVFNAARICKLYGSVASKGDRTELAPWRLSRIVEAPEHKGIVTAGQMRALTPSNHSAKHQPKLTLFST